MKKVIFLAGPTGAGKTEIALLLGKKIGGEIICCDSMQIYKDMDIMTAMPSPQQLALVPHHLFGIRRPTQAFSAADYRKLALEKIRQALSRNKAPIFTAGTGLYAQAVLDGLFISPARDEELRERLKKQALRYGVKYLYKRLKRIDAKAAESIHPNDLRRIVRAIEVYEKTGKNISTLKAGSSGGIFGVLPVRIVCLFYKDRAKLYNRINKRVEVMFDSGLVPEVEKLLKQKLSLTAKQALGIKEVRGFLGGEYGLARAKELLARNTRRYAKRQLSWFRRDKRARWIALDDYADFGKAAEFVTLSQKILDIDCIIGL